MLTIRRPEEIQSVTYAQYVVKYMNKWLREIEITGANSSFGKKSCRQFVDETRPLIDGVYEALKRNVRSRYGKVVVILWSQSRLDEVSIPPYEYDTMGGVCMINYAYDLNVYLDQNDREAKLKIVYDILKDAFEALPEEVGLNGSEVMSIVDVIYRDLL